MAAKKTGGYSKDGAAARLTALRMVDPAAWFAQVNGAIAAAHGDLDTAAAELGVARRTLNRYVASDATLRAVVDKTRAG